MKGEFKMERMFVVVFEDELKAYDGSKALTNLIPKGAFPSMLKP